MTSNPSITPVGASFAVIASGLTKRFGRVTAVDDVSLAIPAGGVFGLLGPNGSGKTTMLAMLAGFIRPTAGAITLLSGRGAADGQRVALSGVGALIERPIFWPYLSCRDNLKCLQGVYESTGGNAEIDDLLGEVGLGGDAARRKFRACSTGMKQRLGIAATLLGNPSLLILDEPTNGLDPAGIVEVREMIRRLANNGERTVILASHLLNEVEQVCDQVGVMARGRLLTPARWTAWARPPPVDWPSCAPPTTAAPPPCWAMPAGVSRLNRTTAWKSRLRGPGMGNQPRFGQRRRLCSRTALPERLAGGRIHGSYRRAGAGRPVTTAAVIAIGNGLRWEWFRLCRRAALWVILGLVAVAVGGVLAINRSGAKMRFPTACPYRPTDFRCWSSRYCPGSPLLGIILAAIVFGGRLRLGNPASAAGPGPGPAGRPRWSRLILPSVILAAVWIAAGYWPRWLADRRRLPGVNVLSSCRRFPPVGGRLPAGF